MDFYELWIITDCFSGSHFEKRAFDAFYLTTPAFWKSEKIGRNNLVGKLVQWNVKMNLGTTMDNYIFAIRISPLK